MTAQDLQPFCSRYREGITKPFSRGEFTYATNAAILVRVPRIDGVADGGPELEDINRVTSIAGRAPLAMDDLTKWDEMPSWPERSRLQACDDCAERGEVMVQCGTCKGTGTQVAYDCEWGSVKIGNRPLGVAQLRPMRSLQQLEFSAEVGTEREAIYFRFNGGCGVLMPVQLTPESKVYSPQ